MTARRPTLSVGLPNYGSFLPAGEWHRFVDLARAADDAGVDRIVLVDHVVMGEHTERYSWGKFPVPPDAPWFEPFAMLSAIAAVTTRVRLGTGILIAPLRPAAFLAKQAATLDQISRGRLDLGVGTGWQREEYDAEGLPFEQRGRLLSDTIAACKVLWRDTPADFDSPTLSFRRIYCEPKPVQPGGVPLWIAGTLNTRNLERLVQHGDAWIPIMGESTEGIAAGVLRIAEAWRAAGRDPSRLDVRAPLVVPRDAQGRPDVVRGLDDVPALVAAGATDISVNVLALSRDAERVPAAMADLAARFRDATG